MNLLQRGREKRAFTLVEIIISVVIVMVLAGLSAAYYVNVIAKAKSAEALTNVRAIQKAELMYKAQTGSYLAANSTTDINDKLAIGITPKYYDYSVVGVTDDDFIVLAQLIGTDIGNSSLPQDVTVIAMNSAGPMTTGYQPYINSNSGGSQGGQTGGSSSDGGSGDSGGSSGGMGGDTGGGSTGGGTTGGNTTSGTGGGTTGGNTTSGSGGGGIVTQPTTDADLVASLNMLKDSSTGAYYYNLIVDNNIQIVWEDFSQNPQIPQHTVAYWAGVLDNTIHVNQADKLSFDSAIAALICHEATHADYDYNPDKWIASTLAQHRELTEANLHIPGDSIDQEYNAYADQVNTWNEIKGTDHDVNNDNWAAAFSQGQDDMKAQIRLAYAGQDLPEY